METITIPLPLFTLLVMWSVILILKTAFNLFFAFRNKHVELSGNGVEEG